VVGRLTGPLDPAAAGPPLPRAFYARPVLAVARDLLGAVLVSRSADGAVAVRLVEVEAYAGGDDPGSHAFRGPGRRNATMFGPPGHAYVYFTYGMHYCLNVVAESPGTPGAVLLRAGEVTAGADLAASRRPGSRPLDLTRGPARLTRALAVAAEHDGVDLTAATGTLTIHAGGGIPDDLVTRGPRVGVAGDGGARPWRLWIGGERWVSPYRPGGRRRGRGSTA
jgi:DNA-3-methyladenine glycosylase